MSPESSLLVRRWPERRPVVLAAAALSFASVGVAVVADPALGVLAVLPVMLAALELGLVGGLVAAVGATALLLASSACSIPRWRSASRARSTGCTRSSPARHSARRA
jgi:hypothetical protein